jgi:hypothetical protein
LKSLAAAPFAASLLLKARVPEKELAEQMLVGLTPPTKHWFKLYDEEPEKRTLVQTLADEHRFIDVLDVSLGLGGTVEVTAIRVGDDASQSYLYKDKYPKREFDEFCLRLFCSKANKILSKPA